MNRSSLFKSIYSPIISIAFLKSFTSSAVYFSSYRKRLIRNSSSAIIFNLNSSTRFFSRYNLSGSERCLLFSLQLFNTQSKNPLIFSASKLALILSNSNVPLTSLSCFNPHLFTYESFFTSKCMTKLSLYSVSQIVLEFPIANF